MFKKKDLPQVEPVKIKPLFGMKPGLWLTIAYTLALCLIIFFVGFLPDILDGSKRVSFTSDAYNSAVYIDGTYAGGTPFTRKVASGEHEVSFRVNGVELDTMTVKVSHPVFFNWLFPRKQAVHSSATLTTEAYQALCAELLEDSNAYGAILSYDYTHPYAGIFTTFARSIANLSFSTKADILESASLFITTNEMDADMATAASILGKDIPSHYAELTGFSTVGVADSETPVVQAKSTSLKTDYFTLEGFEIGEADFSNGKVTSDSYPEVQEAGVSVHTETFNIGAYCITENQYSQFVSANPYWSLSNKEALIAEGLVDEYYLDGVSLSNVVVSLKPVRNISYYAAQAFCQWLSSVSGKNVYLPSENQWIAASLSDNEGGFQKSITPSQAQGKPSAMIGGLWEMTSTPYIPLARLASETELSKACQMLTDYNVQVDMVVKGGSYVNSPTDVDRYSVGVTYRSLCSDFMGFRVAWE